MNIIKNTLSSLTSKKVARYFSNMHKIAYDFNRLKAEQIEVIPQTNRKNSASFIFFHGSGECILQSCVIFYDFLRFVIS